MFRRVLFVLIAICLISCQSKFNKQDWNEKAGWDYPFRDHMLSDLAQHHQLTGLSYQQLKDSLGNPDIVDTSGVYYQIIIDYGTDIDPVHTKDLMLKLNRDSIVTSFQIKEWKKD